MSLITMRQLLDHAADNNYGVPAFNVNNLEQMRAIMLAADQTQSPVIVQASAGARKYAGAPFLRHLIQAAIEEWPHIPVCMHQDHGTSPAVCQRSIQLGFSSVMMDGSLMEDGKTPSSYDYNVAVTRGSARWYRRRKLPSSAAKSSNGAEATTRSGCASDDWMNTWVSVRRSGAERTVPSLVRAQFFRSGATGSGHLSDWHSRTRPAESTRLTAPAHGPCRRCYEAASPSTESV